LTESVGLRDLFSVAFPERPAGVYLVESSLEIGDDRPTKMARGTEVPPANLLRSGMCSDYLSLWMTLPVKATAAPRESRFSGGSGVDRPFVLGPESLFSAFVLFHEVDVRDPTGPARAPGTLTGRGVAA